MTSRSDPSDYASEDSPSTTGSVRLDDPLHGTEDRKRRAGEALRYALTVEQMHLNQIDGDWRVVRDAYLVAADAAEEAGYGDDGPARSGAVEMVKRCRGHVFPGEHAHRCPTCHENAICRWTCSEADLEVDGWGDIQTEIETGLPLAGYADCEACEELKASVRIVGREGDGR